MPLTDLDIDEAVNRYEREADRYGKLSGLVAEVCRQIVTNDAITATVQWRAKDPNRLRNKLIKQRNDLHSVGQVFTSIKDFAGARILTYADSDRPRVVEAIKKQFAGPAPGQPAQDREGE